VLLTNLANRVQPLIRYDLGDSVTMGTTPCPCGNRRPTLSVQGRRDDVLLLEAGGAEPLRVLPLAIETVIEEEAGIHRFQLIQTAPDALCLRVDLPGARRAAKVLARFLKAQGAANVKVAVEDCAPEVNPVSGKLCRIRALAGRRSG
jgi:phenylacetate-coenzyme A ligase PaaK-like adenylate-forming protein